VQFLGAIDDILTFGNALNPFDYFIGHEFTTEIDTAEKCIIRFQLSKVFFPDYYPSIFLVSLTIADPTGIRQNI